MMKKHGKLLTFLCAALLTVTLAAGGTAAFADEPAATPSAAENVPFYNYPQLPGENLDHESIVTKNADGSYVIHQQGGGSQSRLFYGDYVFGGDENPYLIDLTDATIEFSVQELVSEANNAGNIELAFMTFRENGNAFPQGPYGQGFSLALNDDGVGSGANSSFNPKLKIFSYTAGGETEVSATDPWLVYHNSSPRLSYLNKKLTIRIQKQEETLVLTANFTSEESEPNTVGYKVVIPLADLPTDGDYAFDYTQAYFMITSTQGVKMTLIDLSEKNTNDYYTAMGGQTNRTLNVISAFTQAVEEFPESNATAAEIKAFYTAQQAFVEKATGMRKCDAYEHAQALAAAASKVDPVAAASADALISAIGTVEYTAACKEKIDEARALYNALPASVQENVTGYATLEQAETDYAAFSENGGENNGDNNGGENKDPEKSGCSSVAGGGTLPIVGAVLLLGAAGLIALRKKRV